ncbi:MAG: rhomboid family intramembrane serine protease [Brumimicrobium sp.]|nr:rhomboid family intramembrane serine protease [Brumimicrobium sp.]
MNLLNNLTPVVKSFLMLNVILFIITLLAQMQGIPLSHYLGGFVFNSPFFQPYQIVSYFFMHGGFFHIFFNMFALVMFGPVLEQVWGPKRFFIFYFVTAIGAYFLHQLVGYIEVHQIEEQLYAAGYNDLYALRDSIHLNSDGSLSYNIFVPGTENLVRSYIAGISVPVVGASGAIFGILVAFGYLFPNTQLMLLFPPIPIKAKWMVLIMIGIEIWSLIQDNPSDNVAHLAHLGGAIFGIILVLIWQKSSKRFY